MTKITYITSSGDELTQEKATQQLLLRVTKLEEQLELNTKVLRQLLNTLQSKDQNPNTYD